MTRYRFAVLGGAWFVYFGFGWTTAALAPLIAPITRELDLSLAAMGSVLGAWQLAYIVASVPAGVAIDRLGVRFALIAAVLLIAASGALRSLAVGHLSLFLAVGLFGIGGPLVSIGGPKLVRTWFPESERAMALGVYMTGPWLGGIGAWSLTNSVFMPLAANDWRTTLMWYALGVLTTGIVWGLISAHREAHAMESKPRTRTGASQWQVLRTLVSSSAVRALLLLGIGIFWFDHALNNWLPEILRLEGMTPREAGLRAALAPAVGLVSALLLPRYATAKRRIPILLALFACAGAATLLLQTGGIWLMAGIVIYGIALGAMLPITMVMLIETRGVGAENAGAAGGLFFAAAEIGGVLGPVTVGVIAHVSGGFSFALIMLTGVTVILAALAGWLSRIQRNFQ